MIQAPDGRRMSKSLGTGINPLDLVDRHGADATRYGLLKMSSTQDVRFAEGMIEEGAKLANKLWNASRFVLLQADTAVDAGAGRATAADRWILSRLAGAQADVLRLIDAYDFAARGQGALRVRLERLLRLVRRGGQARLLRRTPTPRTAVSATLLWVLERIAGAGAPGDAVRDRGDLAVPARRARAADAVGRCREPDAGAPRRGLEQAVAADDGVRDRGAAARRRAASVPVEVPAGTVLFAGLLDRVRRVTVTGEADAPRIVVRRPAPRWSGGWRRPVAERDRARAKLANERLHRPRAGRAGGGRAGEGGALRGRGEELRRSQLAERAKGLSSGIRTLQPASYDADSGLCS